MVGGNKSSIRLGLALIAVVAALGLAAWLIFSEDSQSQSPGHSPAISGPAWAIRADGTRVAARRGADTGKSERDSSSSAGTSQSAGRNTAKSSKNGPGQVGARKGKVGGSTDLSITTSKTEASETVEATSADQPVPGSLRVTVLHSETGLPVPGAEVFAPMPMGQIDVDGMILKLPAFASQVRKIAGRDGSVLFEAKDLAVRPAKDEDLSNGALVLANAANMVPVVDRLDLAKATGKGLEINLVLAPAVEITGIVADRAGKRIPNASVVVAQTTLSGSRVRPGEAVVVAGNAIAAFRATGSPTGEFRLAVARDHLYIVTVSADQYVPFTSKPFDFRRDERSISVILRHGRSVEGIVTHNGAPLAGAEVRSLTDDAVAKTGTDGRFSITSLSDRIWTNRVTIRVSKKGHSPVVEEALVNDRELHVELPVASTIAGVVTSDGAPVAGATIEAEFTQGKRDWPVKPVRSVAEGVFTIPELGEGSVSLIARFNNDRLSRRIKVNLKAAEHKTGVLLELELAAVIDGTVVFRGPDGVERGLAGARIQRDGKDAATTAGGGIFTIGGLGDAAVTLAVVNRGKLPEHLEKLNLLTVDGVNFYTVPEVQRVHPNPGGKYKVKFEVVPFFDDLTKLVTLDLTLNTGGNLADGQVEVEPQIQVAPDGSKIAGWTETFTVANGSGEVRIEVVEGVNYTIKLTHPRIFTKTVAAGTIKAAPDGGKIPVALSSANALTGYVRDSAGNALPDVDCTAVRSNVQTAASGKTDQHGYFDLGGLRNEEYTLRVFLHSYYLNTQKVRATTHSPEPLDVVLLGANEIRLLVTDAGGTPQPGVRVKISRPASDSPSARIEYFELGETDGQGRKVVNFHWIRHYQVVAYRGTSAIGFINFANRRDQQTREFTVKLEAASTITGRVTSQTSGQPVSDVDVYARYDGQSGDRAGNEFYVRANGAGEFSMLVPAIGNFTMCVRESRAYQASADTPATAGARAVAVTVDPKLEVDGNWAEFISVDVPAGVRAGEQFTANITVRNRGSTAWTASSAHRLGSQSPQDNGRWGTGRIALPEGITVPPGAVHVFTATLRAPNTPGNHQMQWRMVQERVEWFGEFSQQLTITVQPSS